MSQPATTLIPPPSAAVNPAKFYTQLEAEYLRRSLYEFVQRAWPLVEPKPFTANWHIEAICEHLTYVALGDIRNLMINIAPRMTKSMLCSVLFPPWVWTADPEDQFICASYAKGLAMRDAVAARRLIESKWYQDRYGDRFYLLPDDNQKQKYGNSKGGYRISTSTGAATTGEGGDWQVYDDPHNMKDVDSDTKRHAALSWHDNAFRSRANDPNKVKKIYIGQRSHDMDVFGHVLQQEPKRWVLLKLPMEFDPGKRTVTHLNDGRGPGKEIWRDPRKVKGELMNPKRFDAETAATEKNAMSKRAWAAQYNQEPLTEGGLILKSAWWKSWSWPEWHPQYGKDERELPEFFEIIQCWDTAFEEKEQDDFNVRTTWGLFEHAEEIEDPETGIRRTLPPKVCLMLLDRWKEQAGFPVLREEAFRSYREYRPNYVLIEKKSSGHSLIQEMRKRKIPVRGVPVNVDLVYRAHMTSLVLEKGHVYYVPRGWAYDVIEECKKFPQVDHDDQVSSCTIAWQYARRYMGLSFPGEEDDTADLSLFRPKDQRRGYR